MSDRSPQEIMAEMNELMKKQMELQAELLQANWGAFKEPLEAFMDIFKASGQAEEVKTEKTTEGKDES